VFLNTHHTMKTYWETGGVAEGILSFDIKWMWVVSFTPRHFTLGDGKEPPVTIG